MAEDTTAAALCGVMEQALIEKGIDPTLAKALSRRACQPIVEVGVVKTKKAVKRGSRAARTKLSKSLREANRRLRTKSGKLRKGKTQADVMRLAQRLRRKM